VQTAADESSGASNVSYSMLFFTNAGHEEMAEAIKISHARLETTLPQS
jgi:hypothetical protein